MEVKTGSNHLVAEQLENYLDIAREQEFDAVITISNEIPAFAGQHPTRVDGRKLRKVSLVHLSWTQVLAEAVLQKEFRGVADPDQAWILGELIRYLEHPRSGAMEFDDMSDSWVGVRDAVRAGTLRPSDKGLIEVASRFDALLRFAGLSLGRQLGSEVTPLLSRKELADPSLRTQALVAELVEHRTMTGLIKIPTAIAPLAVTADLRAGTVTCYVDIDAPRDGRATTRVKWLVRQLKDAPADVVLESHAARARHRGAAEMLRVVRDDPAVLVEDPTRELRSFRVALQRPMGAKRGRGRGSFIDSVLCAIDSFYSDVAAQLRAWSAKPPTIRSDRDLSIEDEVTPALTSTAISSQDDEPRATSWTSLQVTHSP